MICTRGTTLSYGSDRPYRVVVIIIDRVHSSKASNQPNTHPPKVYRGTLSSSAELNFFENLIRDSFVDSDGSNDGICIHNDVID